MLPRQLIRITAWLAGCLAFFGAAEVIWQPLLDQTGGAGQDFALYRAIVQRIADGECYYKAAGAELRQPRPPLGLPYPTRSVFNWRLPTLALLLASLGNEASRALLAMLAMLALWCWWRALASQPWLVRSGAVVGLATGLLHCLPGWLDDARFVHEAWAGVLLAVALGAGQGGQIGLALTAGLAAALIRELAVPALVVIAIFPFQPNADRVWRERLAWLLLAAASVGFWTLHACYVQMQILPTDRAHEGSWLALGGWRFILKTAHMHPLALPLLPHAPWVMAVLLPWVLWLMAWWPLPGGRPVKAVLGLFVTAYLFIGQPFNYLWGLMYTPFLGLSVGALLAHFWAKSPAKVAGSGAST
jgi:hypothetical protein